MASKAQCQRRVRRPQRGQHSAPIGGQSSPPIHIPCRTGASKGWSPSTITRILSNEKYTGRWVWNRFENRRDPKTGRKRRFPKPESEWVVQEDENLRIVDADLWDRVQQRRATVRKSWPGSPGGRGFDAQQKGRIGIYPTHLFAGSMSCGHCGRTILQVSGKGSGYYGCLSATKGACDNRVLVRRTLLERVFVGALRDRVLCDENVNYVLQRVEKEVAKVYADVPETIRLRTAELRALERKIANFVEFIGEGRGSQALTAALVKTEDDAESLRREVDGLSRKREGVFRAPPKGWVAERVRTLQSVLERKTERAALALRKVLGPIVLEAVRPEVGRPYYRAKSSLDVVAVVEPDPEEEASESGSNSLREWTRSQSIRTAVRFPFSVDLVEVAAPPAYQAIAAEALRLRHLGLTDSAIAAALGVSDKTVAKAVRWIRSR